MSFTPGLMPTLRLDQDNEPAPASGPDILVDIDEDPKGPQQEIDERGNILSITYPDGSISISLDGNPLGSTKEAKDDKDWFRNLIDDLETAEAGRVVEDLLTGVRNDLESREKWINDRAQGLKLLGLSIELPNVSAGASDGAPVEGMSRIRHPLLLEAVLRFQANARSELLPTDGPVKIRNDSGSPDLQNDQLANALERDMNHYLTAVAKEYYPDTDRMLFMLGFSGTSFKKVYFCPLRNRPVSETVDANDLIVNDAATDLSNAIRITHRVFMKSSTVKRLQILGVYRDTVLSQPNAPEKDSVQQEKDNIQGIDPTSAAPDDRNREIYECYCELDLKGFEHKDKSGDATGLEVPYRVTIDVSTREILSIVRNYDKDTEELPEARQCFIKYTFVPGLGFYDIGLLHILGNTTNAITAAWREMLDAGMFANFPGFLFLDEGGRQNTNIFRVPPGGGAPIKASGGDIRQAVMELPYREPGPAFMSLVDNIATTGQRIGGTAELQVGEGRQDAPVGTTLAMLDQATKILNSVHKRMHSSQAEEFQLLAECFREHPESFWQRNKKPAMQWDEVTFEQALDSCDLVPQADPNTASQTQRLMKVALLGEVANAAPTLFDQIKVTSTILQAGGWSNPQQFYVPLSAMGRLPPDVEAKQQESATKTKMGEAKSALDVAKAQEITAKIGQPEGAPAAQPPDPAAIMDAKSKLMDSQTWRQELADKRHEAAQNTAVKYAEIHSKEQLERMGLQKDHLSDQMDLRKEELHLDAARIEADKKPKDDK